MHRYLLPYFVCFALLRGQREDNSTKGLFPSVFNLATNAIISANATCGETGPEVYCKLVEHTFVREPQCGVCDSRRPSKRHPISHAIDGTNKWWQSPTLQNGKQYEWVTITLDLRQIYQIAYVILKAGISPRPGNWILERSLDGLAYKPWQYYAINDAECWETYGIRPTLGKPKYRTDDGVICTSYYSKLNPLENGEIHTSLVNGRPGADEPTDTLREFTKARYIRLRLQKIRTLNADLMTINGYNSQQADKSVTGRYFYSIKDISIGGQCTCFGHAKICPVHPVTGKLQCQCEHNTCGESCEICCPLYNQMPWRPGTNSDGAICEACQCFGHAEECYYDPIVAEKKISLNIHGKYEGGGVCVKCKHHTEGINCEKCEDRYFRPWNVSHYSASPCQECFCLGPGATGICAKDNSFLQDGMQPGDCICKEGFSGSKCDSCAVGYRNYPKCEPCPCHTAGTIDGSTCEGECICKKNVEGQRCDSCKPGYFNLDADNPEGCYKCFCSGMTSICHPNSWGVEIISEMEDWKVTDFRGAIVVVPTLDNNAFKIKSRDMRGINRFYWEAPSSYIGKKLYSYGGELRILFRYRITHDEITGDFIDGPGVILESGRRRIAYILKPQVEGENNTLTIPLHESQWVHLTAAGKIFDNVTREAFSIILNDLTRVLIRANYHDDQEESTLYNVELEHASEHSTSLRKMKTVEVCLCPPNYYGLSCEECVYGYRRVNKTLINGVCEQCNCNNHSETCHPFTGECWRCLHHTTGPTCNLCESGYFGNALVGTPEDCQRCHCPLLNIENNFSPTCLNRMGLNGFIDFICTACPEGYEGEKCERCSDGYFGTPMIIGGFCQPCDCSGNADMSDPRYCDSLTGQCLKCINNTAGWNCKECEERHYGNALLHSCHPCMCNEHGAETLDCDSATGHCYCKENYVGRNCDRCADGYGNIEAGCQPCSCNRDGSIYLFCDPVSGQCPCKPGVFGKRCDTCLDGFYGFSDKGCTWCGCDQNGAESQKCDERTGHCVCRPNVVSKTCSRCEEGFWNILSGKGCMDCECNITGSLSQTCDNLHGQCSCKTGVTGRHCDRCFPGYFGFSEDGCRECMPCTQEGHVCDGNTGECVCPPFTIGERCEKCAPLSWGYNPLLGCQPCDCNPDTSIGEDCDSVTGECECYEGYEGRSCNKCHFAYYNFPSCEACHCYPDGTDITMCTDSGDCHCDNEGRCPCKENVEGIKCKECKNGTFGLTSHNRKGCFECFCFRKTTRCEDAKMVWSQVAGLSRQLTLEFGNTHLATHHYLNVIPGRRGNVRLGIAQDIDRPLYWMLPYEYLGDKILAYNGNLQFRISTSNNRSSSDEFLRAYPLVLLQGNHRLVLIHSRYLPSHNGYYSVHLHEDEWQLLENPRLPVTREIMMVALQNVQDILIRATDSADVKLMRNDQLRLDNVTLDVAVPISPNLPSPYVAVGIEQCHCPPEYSGSSCQNPGFGYYRKRHPNFKESKNVIDLVGWSEPCPCNNRSKICDVDTGVCSNCSDNTDGPQCEICAKGYFGDPSKAPCLPCACPLVTNSFSDICEKDEDDYICVNCQLGYIGKHCERCADGYYGNPMKGTTCNPCNCNPFGSRHKICNQTTGQCSCLRGISGRDCSYCEPRHILTGTGCLSCDTDCTRVLLDDIDFLTDMAERHNLSQFQPPPWIPLLKINKERIYLEGKAEERWETINHASMLFNNFTSGFDLETHFDLLYLRTRNLIRKAPPTSFSAQETREEAEYIYSEVDALWKNILAITDSLLMYGLNQEFQIFQVEEALKEGTSIVEELKIFNSAFYREKADREFRKANALLQQVRGMIFDELNLNEAKRRIADLDKFLQVSVSRIEKDIRAPIQETLAINSQSRASILNLQKESERISNKSQNVPIILGEAEMKLEEARNNSNVAIQTLEDLSAMDVILQNYTMHLEYDHGIMARLNPEYKQIYVLPAIQHAKDLQTKAYQLSSLFSATSEVSRLPLKASNVYREISGALAPARESAEAALETASEAYLLIGENQRSLKREAKNSKRESEKIHGISTELHENKVAELQRSYEDKSKSQDNVLNQINNGRGQVELLNKRLKDLPGNTEELLINASRLQASAAKTSSKVVEKLNKIMFKIEEINPLMEKLKAVSGSGLQNMTLLIQQAQEDLEKATTKGKVAQSLLERVKNKHKEVHPRLIELKNKVALARQKASTIDISLSVDKSSACTRSFQPDVEPGTRNSIILNYAIRSKAKESLLFFLASSTSDDFLAIEMVERKIRFLWNAGGGTKVITHNLTIETNDPQLLKGERWYKIEANRVGNIAELRVQPITDGSREDPWKVTGASPAGHVKMDLDSSSYLYIGGLPKGHQAPRQLKSHSFIGCLYQMILDGKRVGLWNFLTNVGCDGCKEGITEQGDLSAFEFKGYGYAVLPQIRRYKGNAYYITLKFKTFDEDALLFLSPDTATGNFVSLELREGHILYQFDLGNTSRLSLQTIEKYNTGNWTRVVAQRSGLQGELSVDNEIREGTLPVGGPTELHIKKSYLYFGGVPPTFPTNRWQSTTFQGFLGCMKELQIDTTALNLFKHDHYGIEDGCKDKGIYVVSFKGKGFIEVPSQPLHQVANFSFTFQSMQETALLMLSTFEGFRTEYLINKNVKLPKDFSDKVENYYSVALTNGKIEARFGGNVKEIEISTNETYNDGHYHTVLVLKKHRKIILKIDDKEVATARLPVDAQVIDAPETRGLFFGGVREEMLLPVMVKIRDPFKGILKDAILNDKLIDFKNPIDFEGVEIGHERKYHEDVRREFPNLMHPLERCAEMTSYGVESNAVRFGDIRHSYAQIPIRRKDFGWDFNITFEFRTYYPNGLIVLMRNGRRNSHFAVMLQGRRIIVDVQDRKHRRLTSQGYLNNGVWHNVTVIKMSRKLNLTVDGRDPLRVKVRRKLSLRSPLFVGGIPEKTSVNKSLVTESFKGCIKNLRGNGRLIDMAQGRIRGVGSCFSNIELGAYFGGDAYVVYDDSFNLGPTFEVQLQFKTTRPNGVILSLNEASGSPSFSLELNNGKVIATIDAGNEEGPLRAVKNFDKYTMCDGEWHIIIMQYLPQEINLKVDKYDVVYGLAQNSLAPEVVTAVPLYIGGLPENGRQGVSIQDNFVGCMKNMAINNKLLDWIDMRSLHNVVPNSCPVF